MRRLGSVAADAALAAADVVGAVAVVAEQSVVVVVSSIRPEMRMRCAGVGWARQPQTPILELEPDSHTDHRRAAEPWVAPSTHSSSVVPAAPILRWPPRSQPQASHSAVTVSGLLRATHSLTDIFFQETWPGTAVAACSSIDLLCSSSTSLPLRQPPAAVLVPLVARRPRRPTSAACVAAATG